MEDLIVRTLNQEPRVTAEQLLRALPEGTPLETLQNVTFNTFRRIALKEEELLPPGIPIEDLALLFDQLITLAQSRHSRREASQHKEARHV